MSNKELDFDLDETELDAEMVEVVDKGPTREQLKKIEKIYGDILTEDVGLEIELDAADSDSVGKIWKYIQRSRKDRKDEKDIAKISSREYVDVKREDERVQDLNCDFDQNMGRYLSNVDDEMFS